MPCHPLGSINGESILVTNTAYASGLARLPQLKRWLRLTRSPSFWAFHRAARSRRTSSNSSHGRRPPFGVSSTIRNCGKSGGLKMSKRWSFPPGSRRLHAIPLQTLLLASYTASALKSERLAMLAPTLSHSDVCRTRARNSGAFSSRPFSYIFVASVARGWPRSSRHG